MIDKRPFDIYYPYTTPTYIGKSPYIIDTRPVFYWIMLRKYQMSVEPLDILKKLRKIDRAINVHFLTQSRAADFYGF